MAQNKVHTATRLPGANIIISFDKENMDKLFSQGATSKNIIEAVKVQKKDRQSSFLLFEGQSNPNFINFEHSFGLGAGTQGMTITFIDADGEFEERYLSDNAFLNVNTFSFGSE